MSSENIGLASGVAQVGESSVAQKLLEQHAEDHHATVEDAEDEDLPRSLKATKPPLDTQSHELFPELGASKGKSTANVAPVWGAKSNTNGKTNGVGSNAASRSSTPSQAANSAPSVAPFMSIPGRNVESVTLEPQYITPPHQLRRPIPDIIKDINRKSRATITMNTASNGRRKFDATGPQDVAQQALKDLVSQIGTRVRSPS